MKYSKELVYPLIRRYESNQTSREEVCEDTGMSNGSFWYWLRKYRSEEQEEVRFIELEDDRAEDCCMEIYLGDARIEIRGGCDIGMIRRLVGAESI